MDARLKELLEKELLTENEYVPFAVIKSGCVPIA